MNYFFVIIIGLLIGSFLNCLIWRLYKNESLWGRSYCPRCRQKISWYDNIPLLSFIILKAKCRHCHQKISWQYPLVELITSLLFLLSFYLNINAPQLSLVLLKDWLLISSLLVIFVYDWRWQLIPMTWVWPMTAVVFILNLLLGIAWWQILLWGAVGVIFFLAQYLITRRKGVGEGDIWLGLFLGVSFPNAQLLLLIMVLSYCLGSIISIFLLIVKKKGWHSRIALGPFLMTGALIALFYGEKVINWYLALF